MAKLSVEVVTGERVLLSETDVDMVIAPGSDGMLGILPSHAPLITTLASGALRVKKGGTEQTMVIFGGFMEVTPHDVVVLADTAERVEDIDAARAQAARQRAEEALRNRGSEMETREAEAALRRATLRLQVAERRGRRRQGPGSGSVDRL